MTWLGEACLFVVAFVGLAFLNRIADALERIAKVVEDAQLRRCCDDGDGGDELEADEHDPCLTPPPPPAPKAKVLN